MKVMGAKFLPITTYIVWNTEIKKNGGSIFCIGLHSWQKTEPQFYTFFPQIFIEYTARAMDCCKHRGYSSDLNRPKITPFYKDLLIDSCLLRSPTSRLCSTYGVFQLLVAWGSRLLLFLKKQCLGLRQNTNQTIFLCEEQTLGILVGCQL